MKIYVDKFIFDDEYESYHITNIEQCCKELISNDEFITITNESYNGDYSVCITNSYDTNDGWDDCHSLCTDYKEIKYCPFCGEKIEIIFYEIDKSEEHNKLTNEREILNNKRRKTDSKKKERELSEKIYELENEIHKIDRSDNFESYFKGNNIELECE